MFCFNDYEELITHSGDRNLSFASLNVEFTLAMLVQMLIDACSGLPRDVHTLIPGTRKYVRKLNLADRIEVQILK